MNALESIRASLPTEFGDISSSPLYATDGHMLIGRSAVPPKQWEQMKNRRNENRTADAKCIREIIDGLSPAEHKLTVSEVRHPHALALNDTTLA